MRTCDPREVKDIYLREGAVFLKNKIECPSSCKEDEKAPEPPPSLRLRKEKSGKPRTTLPKWWGEMYSRDAKGIDQDTWRDLMKPCTSSELLQTILEGGKEKAAGYDGVNADLVRLLTVDSKEQLTPLLRMLLLLINVAFESGKTLESWRKAVVSMIPKRKEDGSLTTLIGEMRPISVLQEFGKIASKILANRLGEVMLKQPSLMTRAQRAFLKDGSTTQCLNTALNILEDFQVKKKKNPKHKLFMLAYDQVKAYDCVQMYTIRASLERFNFPDLFISYVLSNLENATSCFKTFYGPTEDLSVVASVRQGDPLSPLVYICITDPLHEGLRRNPLYGNCKTGYVFSNDSALIISSLGYADDTLTFCESWQEQWMMHEWMRDFCRAHFFKINAARADTLSRTTRVQRTSDGSFRLTEKRRSNHCLAPTSSGIWAFGCLWILIGVIRSAF